MPFVIGDVIGVFLQAGLYQVVLPLVLHPLVSVSHGFICAPATAVRFGVDHFVVSTPASEVSVL